MHTRSNPPPAPARVVVVMGVSGAGKTEVGRVLAARLGGAFFDSDDFHPPANIAKMSRGQSLTDDDRVPWYERLRREVIEGCPPGATAVLACSALKRAYRDFLRASRPEALRFVFLAGDYDTIFARMAARKGHFMREAMLRSQFATLEVPGDDEADVLTVGIDRPVGVIADEVMARLG